MIQIKPIPTFYNGIQFRSRLEARWSIFLTELHIKFNYEPEGYSLGNAVFYVPDFLLPKIDAGIFLEIKPSEPTQLERDKARRIVLMSNKPLWLANGLPNENPLEIYNPMENGDVEIMDGMPIWINSITQIEQAAEKARNFRFDWK